MSFTQPTDEELSSVARLKEQFTAEHLEGNKLTDTAYLRFLRGRKHDEEKALRALARYIEWRKEFDVDNIGDKTEEFQTEVEAKKVETGFYDRDGRPAVHIYARKHNKYSRDIEQVRKMIIYSLEDVLKRTNPAEERIVICFDLKGFSLNCMDYEVVKMIVDILGFNYPETLHTAFIVNAPFLFSACWAVIRPWLDPVTASKVSFIKMEQLKTYFSEENIPSDFQS